MFNNNLCQILFDKVIQLKAPKNTKNIFKKK